MSKQNLIRFMQVMAKDEQLLAQFQQADNFEAIKTLAREQGLDLGDLNATESQRTVEVISGEITEELSDEELELVAGGFNIGMPPTIGNVTIPGSGTVKGWSWGATQI